MARFTLFAYRDGRHYTCVLVDNDPPDLQPANEIARWMMVEGQFEEFENLSAFQDFSILEVIHKTGSPLPMDNVL